MICFAGVYPDLARSCRDAVRYLPRSVSRSQFLIFICVVRFPSAFPNKRESEMPKLAWNGKEISGWVCDGRELKPKSGASFSNTWIFDGKEIKPKSGSSSSNTWAWNGKELKPKFNASSSNTWIVEGGKAKLKSGASSSNTWDVGDAPILVIAGAIVLRLY